MNQTIDSKLLKDTIEELKHLRELTVFKRRVDELIDRLERIGMDRDDLNIIDQRPSAAKEEQASTGFGPGADEAVVMTRKEWKHLCRELGVKL